MNIYEWFYRTTGIAPVFQQKLVLTLVLYVGFRLLLKVSLGLLKQVKDSVSRYELNKVFTGLIVFTGIMVIGRIWFQWFDSLTVFIGILIGAMLVSLKDVLFDLAGWAYLVWRRPFEPGDWVVVGQETGEVLEIGRVQFVLLETSSWEEGRLRSGRIVHVPNGKVFREKLINYSKGYNYIWNEFTIQLTYDSNWKKAKEILRQVVNRYTEPVNKIGESQSQQVGQTATVFFNKLAPEIYTQVVDGRIHLTTRFLCEPDKRRITLHAIWEDVLSEIAQEKDIQLAYSKWTQLPPEFSETAEDKTAPTSEMN